MLVSRPSWVCNLSRRVYACSNPDAFQQDYDPRLHNSMHILQYPLPAGRPIGQYQSSHRFPGYDVNYGNRDEPCARG